MQNFEDYGCLNPVKITSDSNKIIETLFNYKKYKFRFTSGSLLFSRNLQNNTDVIFITCKGLTEAKTSLINSKFYRMLGVSYLLEIKDWDLTKKHSKRGKLALVYSEYYLKACHFAFPFTTKNVSGLLNFTITLQDGLGNKMSCPSNEIKVLTLSFKIHIVK